MKYLNLILLYLLAAFLFLFLNSYNNGWQFLQPFLVVLLLLYFNSKKDWHYYLFAIIAGFFIDSFTSVFGLNTVIFVLLVFILKNLQLTLFTSKNILSIIILTILSFILYWLMFWAADLIFNWQQYVFTTDLLKPIIQMMGVNILLVLFIHLIYYNFWLKPHEKQSF